MTQDITYHWGENHLLINLGRRLERRTRILYWLEAIITCGLATVFLIRAVSVSMIWLRWITGFGGGMLYVIAALRFLSRIAYREQLLLDGMHFTIIQRTFFSRQVQRYLWHEMGPLHYIGKPQKTDHPLKGKHYDYWGFEAHEHIIQHLHHDGNLYFRYQNYAVRFGRDIYSWHAEEMVRMMQLYAGSRLKLGAEWRLLMQETE